MDIDSAMTTHTAVMINTMGRDATYTASGGEATSIKVIFDNNYQTIDLESGSISSSGPVASCASADVAGAKQGDTMTVDDVNYSITEVKPESGGLTLLVLTKA